MNSYFSFEKMVKAITLNMMKTTSSIETEIPSDVDEINYDYANYVRTVRRLERIEDKETRRVGYEKICDEICRRYHPSTFEEEVFFLADEFTRPYNRYLTYDKPPYISALPSEASPSRLKKHYKAFIFILYTELQRRLSMMSEKYENENQKDDTDRITSMEEARKKGMYNHVCQSTEDVEALEESRKKRKGEEKIRMMDQDKNEIAKRLEALEQEMKMVKGTFSMIGQAAMGVGIQQVTPAFSDEETRSEDNDQKKLLSPEEENQSSAYDKLLVDKMTLESRFDALKLIAIYKNLYDVYVSCTEDAWLYVWGVKEHPITKKKIKRPKHFPVWNAEQGKKVALAELIKVLKSGSCGKYWQKTAALFTYSDGSQVIASALKKHRLSGSSKNEFLELCK